MIRVNFTFGHLDRPDSFTTWGYDIPASVGRHAERQDPAEGLGPKDEHAVPSQMGDAHPSSPLPVSIKDKDQ